MNIIIKDGNKYLKLLSIVPYGGGGFAIILPNYQNALTGILEKTNIEYLHDGTKVVMSRDFEAQFRVNDRVKFSYHVDGFVQFSSVTNNKIISGRDTNGVPKGLGLMSWPLSNPISTGPSMTISFWGIDMLNQARPKQIDNQYVFETLHAAHHPRAPLMPGDEVGYAMAIYIISKKTRGNIITINGRKQGYLTMMQLLPDGGQFMRLRELIRYIDIPGQPNFLGISWFRVPLKFSSKSGFWFGGPSDGKNALVATYPIDATGTINPTQTLMY